MSAMSLADSRPYARSVRWGEAYFAAALLAMILFIPPAIYYLFATSSQAPGVAVVGLIIIACLFHVLKAERALVAGFVLGVTLVSHLFFAAVFFHPVDYMRAGSALLLVALVLIAATCLGPWLFRLSDVTIARTTSILRWTMVAIGVIGAFDIAPPGGYNWLKPVFPFTEPSHYALAFIPLLVDVCVRSVGWRRLAWLLIGFSLGYFLENLTLVVGVLIAAAVSLPVMRPLPWIFAAVAAYFILTTDYFAERLDFAEGYNSLGTNLSVLIYVQGWELVVDAYERTSAWGLGFQQLGLGHVNSAAADQIYSLVRMELNLQDGGFLAAKLLSEFGVLGLIVVLAFAVFAALSALRLRKIAQRSSTISAGHSLALAIVVGFLVEMFVRGIGYFSATTLLFMSACYYLWLMRGNAPSISHRQIRSKNDDEVEFYA